MHIELPQILLLQLFAHILSDFYLQSRKMSDGKAEKGLRSPWLYAHITITFLVSWILAGSFSFWKYALLIATTHFLIDASKVWFRKCGYWFFIDQFAHILIITGVVYGFNLPETTPPSADGIWVVLHSPWLLYFIGYSLTMKPANIAIRELLVANGIQLPDPQSGLLNAGRLIGSIERILAMTLILLGQYSALGLIIAAKSILRFKEAESAKQEYVLIGSLLSFTIALFIALGIRCLR